MKRGDYYQKIIYLYLMFITMVYILLFHLIIVYMITLKLPFFTPPNIFYILAWTITYICISISIYKIVSNYKLNDLKRYFKILLINYLLNQSFTIVFFILKNLFLGFIACLVTFISSLSLYEQTNNLR